MTGSTFGIMPFQVLTDNELGYAAKVLYGLLAVYADRDRECWPSRATLARDLGVKLARNIRAHLRQLEIRGYIERVQRTRNGASIGCGYRLLVETVKPEQMQVGQNSTPSPVENRPPEHTKERDTDSGAIAPDAAPAPSVAPRVTPKKALYDDMKFRIPGRNPGAVVGKWANEFGVGVMFEAHCAALKEEPADYVPWMVARMQWLTGKRRRTAQEQGYRTPSSHGPKTSCIDFMFKQDEPVTLDGEAMPWSPS